MGSRITTLCYPLRGGEVLLMRKGRGLGKGKVNGAGGKVEEGEGPEESCRREVREEVGLEAGRLEFRGLLEFLNDGAIASLCYVFVCPDFRGEPRETPEAKPFWVPVEEVPYGDMWEGDRHWLPGVLRGKVVMARLSFSGWELTKHRVWEFGPDR